MKAGRIIDESQPEEEQVQQQNEEQVKDENALHFENITKAKNYLQKTYKVDVRKLKSPESVKGEIAYLFNIIYSFTSTADISFENQAIFVNDADEPETHYVTVDADKTVLSVSVHTSLVTSANTQETVITDIEDRKAGDTGLDTKPSDTGYYTQFEGEVKAVSPNISYTVSGRKYTVENGENAVAFELRKNSAEGELVYFFNMFSYDIPAGVELGNAKLYAVQADGKRIEIPVKK
jgi:hypothetical protein